MGGGTPKVNMEKRSLGDTVISTNICSTIKYNIVANGENIKRCFRDLTVRGVKQNFLQVCCQSEVKLPSLILQNKRTLYWDGDWAG